MPAKIHGRLASLAITATTNQGVYTVPASRKATISVNFCNRASGDALVRLALLDGAIGTLTDDDYIEYDSVLPAPGVLLRERITLAAGQSVMVRSNGAGQSVVVWGVEEDA